MNKQSHVFPQNSHFYLHWLFIHCNISSSAPQIFGDNVEINHFLITILHKLSNPTGPLNPHNL